MKLWPKKKWKKIVFAFFLTLFVVIAVSLPYVSLTINRDVVTGIDVINAAGSKKALVVYQPGLSSFPRDVPYAFADGLASNGWRVEITTASPQAPSDLSGYGLLVLGFPIYFGAPGTAILRYVNRTGDLNGISTVIIALGGISGGAADTMKQKVKAANGRFYESLTLDSGLNATATDIAREAGSRIAP